MADRIGSVLSHTEFCLGQLRGTPNAGALSGNLALNWRGELGPIECAFLAAVALQASPAGFRDDMIRALEYDKRVRKLRREDLGKYELEKEMSAKYWAARLKAAEDNDSQYGQTAWLKEELVRSQSQRPAAVERTDAARKRDHES